MSRAELEKRILRLHKDGTGILKIGKALGTGTVQRVVMEQLRPFDVDVAEAAFAWGPLRAWGMTRPLSPRAGFFLRRSVARGCCFRVTAFSLRMRST
jgi:hypothetical protein